MLAFKQLTPLFGMGGQMQNGNALPVLPWWNAVAINDVPAQNEFYSTANGRLLKELIHQADQSDKVAYLHRVWSQRLSYRIVRAAEESKIALSDREHIQTLLPFIAPDIGCDISQQALENALSQPLQRILEQVTLAMEASQAKPDVIYLTGGSARSPLLKAALMNQLPGIPIAGGDDFGSVTQGLARWSDIVFR